MMTKEQIKQAQAAALYETRDVVSLGGEVRFRRVSAAEVMRATAGKHEDAILIAASVVDEAGDAMFTVQEAKDLSAVVFAELGRIVAEINGWKSDAGDAEKN